MPLPTPSRRHRFAVVLALVAAAVTVGTLQQASPASAHTGVQSSSPEAEETLTVAPEQVTLTFGHEVGSDPTNNVSVLQVVREEDGLFHSTGCAQVDEASVSTGIALGESGRYLVAAKIVTADGHVSTADYGFTYQRPADAEARTGTAQPPACAEADATAAESLFAPYEAPIPAFVLVALALGFFVVLAVVVLFLIRRATPAADAGDVPPAAE